MRAGSLKEAMEAVLNASMKPISGTEESLKECSPGSLGCTYHLSCCYSHKNKINAR